MRCSKENGSTRCWRCGRAPHILYLGCGAGEPVARYLIEAGARITGVDFAPEMLAIAARRFPDHDWIEAGEATGTVEGWPLHHATLDADEYRALLVANGFGEIDYAPEDAEAGGFTLWLATGGR